VNCCNSKSHSIDVFFSIPQTATTISSEGLPAPSFLSPPLLMHSSSAEASVHQNQMTSSTEASVHQNQMTLLSPSRRTCLLLQHTAWYIRRKGSGKPFLASIIPFYGSQNCHAKPRSPNLPSLSPLRFSCFQTQYKEYNPALAEKHAFSSTNIRPNQSGNLY
jgi:hypothetical protein